MRLTWSCAGPMQTVRETRYGAFLHVIGTNEAPDKAKGAAWTYGLKYYFLNKFNIMQASGIDDPDMRGTEKEEMPKQEASVKPEKTEKETGKGRKKKKLQQSRSKRNRSGKRKRTVKNCVMEMPYQKVL